ncbi:hypothetical protein ANO11243_016530 [Dothideomycetidae sp. 11243]|nr:hypothetical protein ANO11243_016530 [fungal sp. No.11243]
MAEPTVPLRQFQDLQRKYDSLEKQYHHCLARLDKASRKLADCRASVKSWQRYIDSHPKYVASSRSPATPRPQPLPDVSFESITRSSTTPERVSAATEDHPLAKSDLGQAHEYELPDGDLAPGENDQLIEGHHDGQDHETSHRNSSSQTTQVLSDPQEPASDPIKAEPDEGDEPVFVSARVLRRERPARVRKVKVEESQSGQSLPQVPSFVPNMSHTQASDLDALVRHIETPRKRQKIMHAIEHGRPLQSFDSRDSGIGGHSRRFANENTPPSSIAQETDRHELEDVRSSPPTSVSFQARSSDGPLQPLSTNTLILPRTSTPLAKDRNSRKRRESTSQRIADMGEDNSDIHNSGMSSAKKGKRLDRLLQGAETPQNKKALSSRSHTTSARAGSFDNRQAGTPITATKRKAPETTSKVVTTPSITGISRSSRLTRHHNRDAGIAAPPDPQPDEEPLRSRPISRLNLDDFRINPIHAGTTFAYNTSVRDRATRSCLPGCTRPCCTALQQFIIDDDDDDDAAAATLHSWLGDADASHLSADQKEVLVAAARAQRFARAHGRHRQVFDRPSTPPGFWRTDMPSTQEVEEQRAAARAEQRAEVVRRWVEAVRGDGRGRYRFRDEV